MSEVAPPEDADPREIEDAESETLPCPSPVCGHTPEASDRYCEACGTWLGLEGEKPPATGPLTKVLRTTGALKIASIVERMEGKLNDWCD